MTYPRATPVAILAYANTPGVVFMRRTRGKKHQFVVGGPSLPDAIAMIRPTSPGWTFEWSGIGAGTWTIAVS